jgi:hypothetical protein
VPRNLSIFSFKKLPAAFLLALLLIGGLEYSGFQKFDGKFFSHEVDRLLYRLKTEEYHADYLLAGDSVGLQLSRKYSEDPRFAVLATNQAIEMTGQYFLIKRYMEKNPLPRAVIFTSLPFLEFRNLNQVYTENFVLRTFTQIDEILEVFLAKYDLTMFSKMVTYKMLFSYKYRLQLQEMIVGYTNANKYSGVNIKTPPAKYKKFSFVRIFKKIKDSTSNAATIHFNRLVSYLNSNNIDFYYIPVPVMKQRNKSKFKQYGRIFQGYLSEITKKYPNVKYFDEYNEYPEEMFVDQVHYNGSGLERAQYYMDVKIDSILDKRHSILK